MSGKSARLKRQIARATPDEITRSFIKGEAAQKGYLPWGQNFIKQMEIKHGPNFKSVTQWVTENPENPGYIEVTLNVDLKENPDGPVPAPAESD